VLFINTTSFNRKSDTIAANYLSCYSETCVMFTITGSTMHHRHYIFSMTLIAPLLLNCFAFMSCLEPQMSMYLKNFRGRFRQSISLPFTITTVHVWDNLRTNFNNITEETAPTEINIASIGESSLPISIELELAGHVHFTFKN